MRKESFRIEFLCSVSSGNDSRQGIFLFVLEKEGIFVKKLEQERFYKEFRVTLARSYGSDNLNSSSVPGERRVAARNIISP